MQKITNAVFDWMEANPILAMAAYSVALLILGAVAGRYGV